MFGWGRGVERRLEGDSQYVPLLALGGQEIWMDRGWRCEELKGGID